MLVILNIWKSFWQITARYDPSSVLNQDKHLPSNEVYYHSYNKTILHRREESTRYLDLFY